MKNKIFFLKIFFYIFLILFPNLVAGDEFEFNASEIETYEKGNLLIGSGGIQINDGLGLVITAEKFEYDKLESILKITENVLVKDTLTGNLIKSNQVTLYKELNIVTSKDKTIIELDTGHIIESSNITFNRDLNKIFSEEKTLVNSLNNDKFIMSDFTFTTIDKVLASNDVQINDYQGNVYNVKNIRYNMKTNEILGKDISLNFNNPDLKSGTNEPRLKGNSFFYKENITQINSGVFTTCKKMTLVHHGY